MRRLLTLLLLLSLSVHQSTGQPSIASVSYKVPGAGIFPAQTLQVKGGQALQLDLQLAEYEVTFDRDVYRLEVQDCAGVSSCPSTPDLATCPPCNYASRASCGTYSRSTTASGCPPCNPAICSGTWIELNAAGGAVQDLTSLTSLNSFVEYRVFVPEGQPYCNSSLFFRLATIYGDADIYVSRTPVAPSDIVFIWPWCSAKGRSDNVHICPSDAASGVGQDYDYGAGTYFVYIVGNLAENAFNLSLSLQPVAPPPAAPQDMSWCASQNGTLLADGAATWGTETYKCLRSDVDYDVLLNDPDGVHHFIARIEPSAEPCRTFGFTHTDILFAHTLYLSFTNPLPSGAAADASPGTVLYSTDYPRREHAISFCSNPQAVQYVYITIEGGGQVRLFSTSNRQRFRATALADVGSLWDAAGIAQEALLMRCPTASVPIQLPCVTRVGLVGAAGGGVANGRDCQGMRGLWVVPPLLEPPTLWPPGPFLLQNGQPPRALYRPPEWSGASNAFVPNRFSFVLVQSVSTFTGLHQVKQQYFSDDDIAACYPDFYSGMIVDRNLLPVSGSRVSVNRTQLPCDAASFAKVKQRIDALVTQITTSTQALLSITAQLDSENMRDAYVGCADATRALLDTDVVASTLLSTDCLFPATLNDPCCSGSFDWNVCCLPRSVQDSVATFSLPSAPDALAATCQGPECVATFLADYVTTTNYGCSNALIAQEQFNVQSRAPWIACSDRVFGYNLVGASCAADADCAGGVCDTAAGVCVNGTYDSLIGAFLTCLLDDQPGVVLPTIIRTKNVAGTTTAEIIAGLRAAFVGSDCVRRAGGLALEAGASGADVFGDPAGCPFTCSVTALYTFFEAPLSCLPSGGTDRCGGVPGWAARSASQAACEARRTCNWFDCVAAGQANAACNTTCLTKPAGVCTACTTPTSCFDFATVAAASGTGSAACAASAACQLADGTWAALSASQCVATFRCTHPCWNGTAEVPCADEAQCLAAGECSDEPLTDPVAGANGACVLSPQPYHLPPCTVDTVVSTQAATDPVPLVFAHPLGCILHNVTRAACLARTDRNGRFLQRAHSAAECAAHGCGCEKPTVGLNLLRSTVIGPPSDAAACAACSPSQPCTPYATWTPARWLPGSPRPLQWRQTAQLVPAYTWRTDAFDFAAFGAAWDAATAFLYNAQASTAEQCRFNRVAAALEAVSCGCGASGTASCYKSINTSLPIGVGTPCAGAPLTLNIPPHSLEFSPTSVSAAGSCLRFEFFSQPRSTFARLPRGQSLSTYFTNFEKAAVADFEFRNRKGAIVGQVIGDALTVMVAGAASNVTVCLDFNTFFDVISTLKLDTFPVLDLATVDGGDVTPLQLPTTLRNGGFCAVVANFTEHTYAPVIRRSDWASHPRPGLSLGEKIVFYVAAACYLAVVVYATWHLVWIIVYPSVANVWLTPPLWLCFLFAVTSLIRMVYLILLGAEQIRTSNVGNMVLVEAPTFVWFSATTLVVFLWVSVTSTKQQKRVAVIFRRLIITSNALMWGLFIAFIVLFVVLKDKRRGDNVCQGRLGDRVDREPRRILFIAYQVFLAVVALMISFGFLFYGIRVYRLRTKIMSSQPQQKKNAKALREERHLLGLVIVCSFSFAAHAVLLLVLALVDPGIPYLVLILVAVEVLPTFFVLWGNPSPRERREVITTSRTPEEVHEFDKTSSISPTGSSHAADT